MDGMQNVISKYTRAEAIADGLLVDITTWTKRVGIVFSVAVSRAVWYEIVEPDGKCEDASYMSRLAQLVKQLRSEFQQGSGDQIDFVHTAVLRGKSTLFPMYATVLPGDDLSPVITVMLRDET